MYTVMERYMVQHLKHAGLNAAKIEQITGMSESTIRRISQEAPITEPDESQFRKSRKLGRPSSVAAYTEQISAWLREERPVDDGPMKSTEVLSRLRQMGYTGGKSAVFELVRHLQPARPVVPIVRFVGVACLRHRVTRRIFPT
jgi:predicted DNA-binding transcriptional regulator AlpA